MALKMDNVSTATLLAEVKRRRRLVPRIRRERNRLIARLEALDQQLAAIDGLRRGPGRPPKNDAVSAPRRRRARNKVSLADALAGVIKTDSPMSISEIMSAVQKRGYKTKSRQFRNIVTQRLAADKRFKRAGRGQYIRVG
jgi:hypothetical protein